LKPGDIVVAVDGEKVTSSGDLVAKLHSYKPGDTVQMTVLRNGTQTPVPVTLQKLDDNAGQPASNTPAGANPGTAENNSLGLVYEDQTEEIQSQLPEGAPKGPVVVQVDPQGPAAQGGLQQGDVVLRVGNTVIYSAKQLTVVLKKSDLKGGVRLFVWRNGVTLYAFLQSGDQ
jgi:serine protease Do